ncbi:MAG: adenylate kinase [Balneolaceae bacterium]
MKLVLFGPPGAGKGTQASKISAHYNIAHLSTGDIFRSAIKNETSLGKEVKSILDSGELVPDQTVVDLVAEELKKESYKSGYILDGFPRTVAQAEAFDSLLEKQNDSIDAFISLNVPEDELIKRILSRGEGRSDDTEEGVKRRLQVYHKETRPVKEYYEKSGVVFNIEGVGSVEEIFSRIKSVLDK